MRILNLAALVLFLGAVAIFCFQNLGSITIAYLNWRIVAPLPVLALLTYLAGMISGWAVLSFLRRTIRAASVEPRRPPAA